MTLSRRPSISSRACSKHKRNKRCFAVIGLLQPPAVAVLVEERYGQSLRRALLLLESESMLPEASYETSRSDPVGLLQRISATQSDRTQYVLVVTDMADSFDRFSIAACSPGASSGSRATPAGWTASWRSCKSRGISPSCGGRRMADTAAHLVDHVIPDVPVRQWVLSHNPESHHPMAATEPILRFRRVGVPFGEVNHTPRARQCLAGADCAAAENHPTGMGDLSDHATHARQSIATGRYRSEAGRRSTRPRIGCESGRLYRRRPRQTPRRGGGVGVRTGHCGSDRKSASPLLRLDAFTTASFPRWT